METGHKDQESWVSDIDGTVVVVRLDHRGELTKHEVVTGGRTFHITPEERRINQERAASPALDPFANGMLRPVRLLDDSEEARELAENPNVMAESDMKTLLKSHHKTFSARLAEITNPYALQRMLQVATSEDVDASVSKVTAIKERLTAVAPGLVQEDSVVQATSGPGVFGGAVTPR